MNGFSHAYCRAPRHRHTALHVALLLALSLFVAPVLPAHAGTAARSAQSDSGTRDDITKYMKLPGDQVVVVPSGRYRAGTVTTDHPETKGRFGGWLVLVAASPSSVVVDLQDAALTFRPGASRILMVGFKFENGSIDIGGNHIAFWYTDHTFPADVWVAQAPDPDHPERGRYRAPRTVYAHDKTSDHVTFLGSDIHDASTGILISKSDDTTLRGVHMWGFGDKGLDPQDVTHSDAIGGVAGDSRRLQVTDSWVEGRIVLIDAPGNLRGGGPNRDFLFENLWVSDSPSAGFIFTSRKPDPPRGNFGTRRNVRSWGHHAGVDRVDIVGERQVSPNSEPDVIDVNDINVVTNAPRDEADNPAAQWRARHPYDSWPSFFGRSTTSEDEIATQGRTPSLGGRAPGTPGGGGGYAVALVVGAIAAAVALLALWWGRRRRRARRAGAAAGGGGGDQAAATSPQNSSAKSTFASSATDPDEHERRPVSN